jgi:hypothetical protein
MDWDKYDIDAYEKKNGKKDRKDNRGKKDDWDSESKSEWEPVWTNYLVSDESDAYATIMAYDETYSTLWLTDSYDAKCKLSTDFKTDDMEDGAYGFEISDVDDMGICPYVE